MAKRSNPNSDPVFFPDLHDPPPRHRPRAHKALLIPRILATEAAEYRHQGPDRDRAHKIISEWADMLTGGHLQDRRETATDAEFLRAIFSDALGYLLKTQSPTAFQLDRSFAIAGVGSADGAIGDFPTADSPVAIIELKDAETNLDRDRSQGRTAVQQCWEYLNNLPGCPWGIVSNFHVIRLYHRDKTPQAYEEFSLAEMRDNPKRFNEFYCLFNPRGLLRGFLKKEKPLALRLLAESTTERLEVGDRLYDFFSEQRAHLIEFLMKHRGKSQDTAIRLAQKLLDRIIFIAFCEQRELLRPNVLEKAWSEVPPFSKVTNPRWQNFRSLFEHVDKGHPSVGLERGYNGGLFRDDDDKELDALDLADEPWTTAFRSFSNYDYRQVVDVDVLGHLFEKSIAELEKLRPGGLYALTALHKNGSNGESKIKKKSKRVDFDTGQPISAMPKSAQRKRFGTYYTPPAFTSLIVERTVDRLIDERFAECAKRHKVDPESREPQDPDRLRACWRDCLTALSALRICDPACGSGAFLIRAYESLAARYQDVVDRLAAAGEPDTEKIEASIPDLILRNNLFGMDLSQEAVEITQLALWIRTARRDKPLTELSKNIVWGNSLVADSSVDQHARSWESTFPDVFAAGGFDAVIGNPPWERLKVQEREFFSLTEPDIAQAVSAAERRKLIGALPRTNPELYQSYETAKAHAERVLGYARNSEAYPLTGRGDINTYMLFAELARKIVAPRGIVGLLTPSGIATDDTTKEFFNALMRDQSIACLYDFENKAPVFPDVHRSFKFSVLIFGGSARKARETDFVFFAHSVEDVAAANKQRHIKLSAEDMALFNPNTRTCPIFRTKRDADLTRAIYRRVPILIDHNRKKGGNPWGIRFFTMFHQTNDAEKFTPGEELKKQGFKPSGNRWVKGKRVYLPLYEAKMVQAYDHRAASVVIEEENWFRQGQKAIASHVDHVNPEYCTMPRWWVDEVCVLDALGGSKPNSFLAFKNVTSPTNRRTMIAAMLPVAAVGNSAPLILFGNEIRPRMQCCLLANLNSFALDYVARQKIGNVNLNFFLIEQFPMFSPDTYAAKCPWDKKRTLESWISDRVLKLSCTADDMKPLAEAAGFKGSQGDGVHKWIDADRAQLRAELDAAYFHLYGISRDDVAYILGTFTGTGADEQGAFGRDDMGHLVLKAYDELSERA